jgi:hypothetical protein
MILEKTPLCELSEQYGSDKHHHGYSPYYFERFKDRLDKVTSVFELGICGPCNWFPAKITGASLHMWRDFFPNAEIGGCDIESSFLVSDDRIWSVKADETKPEELVAALKIGGSYDLIIDDAIHDPMPQLVAAKAMVPFLKSGGLYAIEDFCPYKMPDNGVESFLDLLSGVIPKEEGFTFGVSVPDVTKSGACIYKDERIIFIEKHPLIAT